MPLPMPMPCEAVISANKTCHSDRRKRHAGCCNSAQATTPLQPLAQEESTMLPTRNNTWVSQFERLYALQRELDHAFGETETMQSGSFVPPMDVVETADEVLCHLA